jgi:hypothetical protein
MHRKQTGLSNYATTGAVSGAWWGWLLGLCIGVGFLRLPAWGIVLARGSISTAFLVGIVGTVTGAVIGGLVGALITWTRRQKEPHSMDRPD